MRILGIDPGFGRMGYGIIEKKRGDFVYVAHGCLETSPRQPLPKRLREIAEGLARLIKQYQPSLAAVEEVFFYKNAKTAIAVAEARGAILLTLVQNGLAVHEYTPLQVKQAITGYGRAEKRQIQTMLPLLLHMEKQKIQDDAADALAIALTCGAMVRPLPYPPPSRYR